MANLLRSEAMKKERQYEAVRPKDNPLAWLSDVVYLLWLEKKISYSEYESAIGWAKER
jgi:hypothetical protein